MLKSMTGYGDAQVETASFVFAVEAKSVNNRFLKVHVKLPEELLYLQNDFEDLVRAEITRGSVFVTVVFTPTHPADIYDLDTEVLKKYLAAITRLKLEIPSDEEVHVKDLLLLPGVVRTTGTLTIDKAAVLPAASDAMRRALKKVLAMRLTEGANLEEDLRLRADRAIRLLGEVKHHAPRAVEQHHAKLDRRVRQLLGDQQAALAPEDILKEVAILAERSDISEEIARMDSHVKQFLAALDSPEPVGRKLEFLAQEMFRESTTMGAKALSAELHQHLVDLKAEIDRLKEQVLNIE